MREDADVSHPQRANSTASMYSSAVILSVLVLEKGGMTIGKELDMIGTDGGVGSGTCEYSEDSDS